MRIARSRAELLPRGGVRALVPTMGALHEGHASLIRAAKSRAGETVVSCFVNPSQFGPTEDFSRYPRSPEADAELAAEAGADVLFLPDVQTIYPDGVGASVIHIDKLGDKFEGAARPGHFDGVATVVAKLFGLVRPDIAVFGAKDLQQCAIVRRLAAEFFPEIEIAVEPTVRAPDGLALSSRNQYLSASERRIAPRLYSALCGARTAARASNSVDLASIVTDSRRELEPEFKVEYLAIVDRNSMDSLSDVSESGSIIVAAYLGTTRLIDNVPLFP